MKDDQGARELKMSRLIEELVLERDQCQESKAKPDPSWRGKLI